MTDPVTTMTLSTILENAQAVVANVTSAFTTLSNTTNGFGYVLFIPMTLALARALIGIVKSVLFFRRGRRRG